MGCASTTSCSLRAAKTRAKRYAPALVERGAFVIDNSSTFRMRDDVPLVIPEVNAERRAAPNTGSFRWRTARRSFYARRLPRLRDVAGLRSVRVATYQAASGAGRAGLDELSAGERAVATDAEEPQPQRLSARARAQRHSASRQFRRDGYSGEERKVRDETRKMLGLPNLRVSATTVRVPVRTAHSEAVWFETERDTSVEELADAFATRTRRRVPPRRHRDAARRRRHGCRARRALARAKKKRAKRNFALWCVGDQLRKGAATNGVQILELLLARGFVNMNATARIAVLKFGGTSVATPEQRDGRHCAHSRCARERVRRRWPSFPRWGARPQPYATDSLLSLVERPQRTSRTRICCSHAAS